jgi:hypothetical protein
MLKSHHAYYDRFRIFVKMFFHALNVLSTYSFRSAERTMYAQVQKMPELLIDLQRKKAELLEEIFRLRDFRAGCITPLIRRCGKPTCRCAQPGDPGHGPNLRLTYKLDGKTRSESLPNQAAVRKAQAEIAEFRRFQRLVKALVVVNTKICRLRSFKDFGIES